MRSFNYHFGWRKTKGVGQRVSITKRWIRRLPVYNGSTMSLQIWLKLNFCDVLESATYTSVITASGTRNGRIETSRGRLPRFGVSSVWATASAKRRALSAQSGG